jgi:hypothetical protein
MKEGEGCMADDTKGPIRCGSECVKKFVHGQAKAEVLNRVNDRHLGGSILNVPSGMSPDNPMQRTRFRKQGKGKCC